jgi:hypothetical protein
MAAVAVLVLGGALLVFRFGFRSKLAISEASQTKTPKGASGQARGRHGK